ncbi:MAG: hypothetical protein IPI46_06560 [Bacteroidetes bacterium]|nr:hypothetical protein [Bacteroidota bacterium]
MKQTILIYIFLLNTLLAFSKGKQSGDSSTSNFQKKATYLSASYGVSNYLGDLGGNSGAGKPFIYDNNFKQRTSMAGLSISHVRNEWLGFRLGYMKGKIAGSDQDAEYKNKEDKAYLRYKRNLDFKSSITEWSALLEVYPLKMLCRNRKSAKWNLQPYLLGGIGRYKFNPQGSYYNEVSGELDWVDLQPLGTEGQGMKEYQDRQPYTLSQTNLPYGFGLRYDLGTKTSLSIEYIGRKLFTDYLDDVSSTYVDPTLFSKYLSAEDAVTASQVANKSNVIDPNHPFKPNDKRGNSTCNDFYYSCQVKFSIQISKSGKKVYSPKKIVSPYTFYKYDRIEICE